MTKRCHYCYLLTRTLPEGGCMYYVGIRTCPVGKTPRADTKYMGSGTWIKRAVNAHPGEFSKTILDVFATRAEAKAMERALVGLATANSPWSYNLRQGGEDRGLHSEESKAKLRASQRRRLEEPAELEAQRERNRSPDRCANISAGNLRRYEDAAERTKTGEASQRLWDSLTPAQREARTAGLRKANERRALFGGRPISEAAKAKMRASQRRRYQDPGELKEKAEITKDWWANATEEQRSARVRNAAEGQRRAKAERARVQREVQMILAALIVNKYGGAEAA